MSDNATHRTGQSFDYHIARIAVGTYDAAMDVRTATMNQVRDVIRKRREGISMDEPEDEKDPDERNYGEVYNDDNLPDLIEEMGAAGQFSDHEVEYLREMLAIAQVCADAEERAKSVLELAKREPIYTEWLENVYGVGHTLTARMLERYGYCEDFDKPSQIWWYAGMAPDQKRREGERDSWNAEAKRVAWLVADRIIMQGDRSRYKTEFYDPYKAKQIRRMEDSMCQFCGEPTHEHSVGECESMPDRMDRDLHLGDFEIGHDTPDEASPPWNRAHADDRARRYLAKKFLKHFWWCARTIKGLETPDEYIIAHGGEGHTKMVESFENPAYARRVLSEA